MTHANEKNSDMHDKQYEQPKRGLIKRTLMIALPLLVLIAAVMGVMLMGKLKPKTETKGEAPSATPVVTAFAEPRSVELSVKSQGEVKPRTEINLAALVGGRVKWLAPGYLEGGRV